MLFESYYLGQIERYYRERSREHLVQLNFVQPDPFRSANPDDPPFRTAAFKQRTPPVIVTWRRFRLAIALCGPSRYVTSGTSTRVITLSGACIVRSETRKNVRVEHDTVGCEARRS